MVIATVTFAFAILVNNTKPLHYSKHPCGYFGAFWLDMTVNNAFGSRVVSFDRGGGLSVPHFFRMLWLSTRLCELM